MNQKWSLEKLFPGSMPFADFIIRLKAETEDFKNKLETYTQTEFQANFTELVETLNTLLEKTEAAHEYSCCCEAEDAKNKKAAELTHSAAECKSNLNICIHKFQEHISFIDQNNWQKLLSRPKIKESCFALNELRLRAKEVREASIERVISSLAKDGYHPWENLHTQLEGILKIEVNLNEKKEVLSTSQTNQLLQHQERVVRAEIFKKERDTWKNILPLIASSINHIAGFRLTIYKERNWDSFLKESLDQNRIQKESVEAMWNAVTKKRTPLKDFFALKAKQLKLEKLAWYDLEAPTGKTKSFSYEEAREIITQAFTSFDSNWGMFTKNAFESHWVDSENRNNKKQGAFCSFANFPSGSESRIMLTYGSNLYSILTLAHELGHAYHFHVLKDLPFLARNTPITLAETASQFAEEVVIDYLLNKEKDQSVRQALLERHLHEYSSLFLNIHARYLFETRFYEKRKNGFVNEEALNDLMEQAQKESYMNTLSEYKTDLWATKMHFYLTHSPFYNYPYTVGFIISKDLFEKIKNKKNRSALYTSFLQDTGSITTEDIIEKHLEASPKAQKFWEHVIENCLKDVGRLEKVINENS